MKWKILKKKKEINPHRQCSLQASEEKKCQLGSFRRKKFFKRLCVLLVQFDKRKMEISSYLSVHTFTRKLSYLIRYIADRSSIVVLVNKYLSEAYKKISVYFIPIF